MRQTKRFAVVGSDARQAAAGRALARAGYTVGGVQQLFVSLEFFYYWFHRASHTMRWFWNRHSVHHSTASA